MYYYDSPDEISDLNSKISELETELELYKTYTLKAQEENKKLKARILNFINERITYKEQIARLNNELRLLKE